MLKDSGDVCDGDPSQTEFSVGSVWTFSFKPVCPQHQKESELESKYETLKQPTQWNNEILFNQGTAWDRTECKDFNHIFLCSVFSLKACSLTTFSISWVADQFHPVLSDVAEGLFPSIIPESWLCVCCLFSGLISPGWRSAHLSSSTNLTKLPFNVLFSNAENNWWWIPHRQFTRSVEVAFIFCLFWACHLTVAGYFLEEMTDNSHLSSRWEIRGLFTCFSTQISCHALHHHLSCLASVFFPVLHQPFWDGEIRIAGNIQEVNTLWIHTAAQGSLYLHSFLATRWQDLLLGLQTGEKNPYL